MLWGRRALVILAVVLMAMLAGTLGALVAAPRLAVTLVLVKMLYIENILGDQSVDVIGETSDRPNVPNSG